MDGMKTAAMAMDAGNARALLDSAIASYYDDIRLAMRKRGTDQGLATEIVHDLYLQLCRKPERLRGKTSVRAYLIRAALNLGIDRARRRAFEARLFEALEGHAHGLAAPGAGLHARIDLPRRLAALQQAIFSLPPQCRNVFIAHRIAGMDKPAIAAALGIKRDTVDRHLRNALLRCMEKMDEFENRQS